MFYKMVRLLLVLIFKLLFRYEITGKQNIPKSGPVILASNHVSYVDPILIAFAGAPRPVNYMAKSELFKIPIFGSLIRALNAFPIKRGIADKGAIAHSLKVLSKGGVLLIFPEGTRQRSGNLGPAYPGVTSIALKTGAPIVPIGLIGTDKILPDGRKLLRFPKLKVRIGDVIKVEKTGAKDRKQKEEELTKRLMNEINNLVTGG
ncbi:MAG: lysophospholipid acyltransferase family protein [Actinomycetota bacterium]|nr:lysophospholipid acyltransferase family protein [Actinomycetota bacterium]